MKNKVVLIIIAVLLVAAIILYIATGDQSAGGGSADTGTENYESAAAGSVLISEAMAKNSGSIPAPDGGFYDWVELYNDTEIDIDLSGWGLSDTVGVAAKWTFGEGTVIPAKGYLIVYCGGPVQSNTGILMTDFGLKSGEETVILSDATGKTVDALPLPEITDGHSLGRDPSDLSQWLDLEKPTPGFENSDAGRAAYEQSMDASSIGLQITELQSSNATTLKSQNGDYPDWIEIYNPTASAVDLSGFGLSDDREKPLKWTFPQGTVIEPGEYLLVYCDSYVDLMGDYPDELHATFSLSAYEESAVLSDSMGRCIDAVDYTGLTTDSSYARDASGQWSVTSMPTPGYANTEEGFSQYSETAASMFPGGLVITEAMGVNTATVKEKDGNYYDWVEVYNETGSDLDISGYGLTDDPANPFKWTFPEGTVLSAGERRLVMCSGLTEGDFTYLHASFKLDSVNGEVLLVTDKEGQILDKLFMGKHRADVSVGKDETTKALRFFSEATPGAANGSGYLGYAPAPSFGLTPGFYTGSQTVAIHVPEGAKVYYTTDGSLPDSSANEYTGPITIDKTTSLRAVAVKEGFLNSGPVAASYLIDSPHESTLSVVFVTMEHDDLFDPETGIYVPGPDPGSAPNYKTANYQNEWERPCNVEIFDTDGTLQVSMEMNIRIFGAFSRLREQKGFALFPRAEVGTDVIDYPICEHRDRDHYSCLVLRAGGQDSTVTKIKDIVATGLVDGTTNLEVQAYRQAVLYINGEYFGIYNIREKVNKSFIQNHYPDINAENIDLLVGNGTALEGDNTAYKELISWCEETDFSVAENYEELKKKIDVDNYIDYLICEMYTSNTDTGNIKFFRERTEDGQWRWIYYDFCWTFLGVDRNMVEWFTNPQGHGVGKGFSNQLTISCMQSSEFRQQFIERAAELLNTIYTPENVLAKIEECSTAIENEIRREGGDADRWPEGGGAGNWAACVKNTRNFARRRRNYMIQHICEYFGLSDSQRLEIFGEYDEYELE